MTWFPTKTFLGVLTAGVATMYALAPDQPGLEQRVEQPAHIDTRTHAPDSLYQAPDTVTYRLPDKAYKL